MEVEGKLQFHLHLILMELNDLQQEEMEGKLQFHSRLINGTGSGSFLDSISSTLLKKLSSDVWVAASFSHHR